MFKKLLVACALGAATMIAQAAPTPQYMNFNFSYTGFFDDANEGIWNPDLRLAGSFIGRDFNEDGKISKSEAGAITFAGDHFQSSCGSFDYYLNCELSAFSFTPGEGLKMVALYEFRKPSYGGSSKVNLGVSYEKHYYESDAPPWYQPAPIILRWGTGTQFDISPNTIPVVPEPGTYAMILAGLAGMGLLQRRRRNKQA